MLPKDCFLGVRGAASPWIWGCGNGAERAEMGSAPSGGLFTPWTMKSSSQGTACKKICDWLLNLGLHQGKNECQSGHGIRGFQNTYFKAYIIH